MLLGTDRDTGVSCPKKRVTTTSIRLLGGIALWSQVSCLQRIPLIDTTLLLDSDVESFPITVFIAATTIPHIQLKNCVSADRSITTFVVQQWSFTSFLRACNTLSKQIYRMKIGRLSHQGIYPGVCCVSQATPDTCRSSPL